MIYTGIGDITTLFERCGNMSPMKFGRYLNTHLSSPALLEAIYNPRIGSDQLKRSHMSAISSLYETASRPKAIRAIVRALDEYGYRSIRRTGAVFIVSLVNIAMEEINTSSAEIGRRLDHGTISEYDKERKLAKLTAYQKDAGALLDIARKIVADGVNDISGRYGVVPKAIACNSLYTVPETRYIGTYKLGFYLKSVLSNLYGFVDITGYDEMPDFDIDWTRFFAKVFGHKYLPDIASLLLLEGKERISGYTQHPAAVQECWDALTAFALRTLNGSPSDVRNQMIELFLKRINSMLDRHGVDLRVDLETIDGFKYSALYDAVKRYGSKFDSIREKRDILRNSNPTT